MGAFILAGIVFVVTLAWCAFIGFANGMASAPGVNDTPVMPWFVGGCFLAVMIAATHWFPVNL